jgi:hypothetical protein
VNEALPNADAGAATAAPPAPGITPPSKLGRQGAFLTDVIVELGFANPHTVQEAVDAARQLGKTPERYLLDNGAIDERQLSLALAERNGLDHVDLAVFDVDAEASSLIDRSTAARYPALPIAFAPDGALIVAFEDPYDSLGINDIEVMAKTEVRPVVATGAQLRALIENLPESGPAAPQFADDSPAPASEPEPVHEDEIAEPEPQPERAPGPPPPGDAPGELSAALVAVQERTRHAIVLAEATERRIDELEDADGRVQEAAAALADERAQREREREQSVEREEGLRRELAEAQDKVAALEQRLAELRAAADAVTTATEQLAALSLTMDARRHP